MKNSFKTPLVVEVMPSGKRFRLHHEFTYRKKYGGGTAIISIPTGFETDFASIPRFARILIPKLGRYNKAAVIHDWMYQSGKGYRRKFVDQFFLEAMSDLGVAKWKRYVMYWAVRLGGWMAWKKR